MPKDGGSDVAAEDLTRVLDEAGVPYELLPHVHTESAVAEAEALGFATADVAKTLIVKTPDGYMRAVLSATDRLDLSKLRELLGVGKHKVHLATEEDLGRDFPEFELGAVPPVGGDRRDPVVIDSRLAEQKLLVIEAGSHEESVRIATEDLIRLSDAQLAGVAEA
jgi:Ala-tRNA(Pro) deacylase